MSPGLERENLQTLYYTAKNAIKAGVNSIADLDEVKRVLGMFLSLASSAITLVLLVKYYSMTQHCSLVDTVTLHELGI